MRATASPPARPCAGRPGGPPAASRRGRARRGPLVALAVLVGLPLVLEGVARVALGAAFTPDVVTEIPLQGCVEFDPELGWRNPPGLRARAVFPSLDLPLFEYEVSVDEHGRRGAGHAFAKPPGVLRVAAVGDSFTWGWGVDDEDCWTTRLEEGLGPGVEVINLGVPGYGTDQELLLLEREGLRYAPDLVLLLFVLNDVEGNELDFSNGFGKPILAREGDGEGGWAWRNLPVSNTPPEARATAEHGLLERLRRRSALCSWLVPRTRTVARPHPLAGRLGERTPEELRAELLATPWPFPLPEKVPGLLARVEAPGSSTHELLRRLSARCRAAGVPLVAFALSPHDAHLFLPAEPRPPAVAEAEAAGVPYRTELSLALARVGAELGFDTLALDAELVAATTAGENLNNGDGHLNARGNELVAEALRAALGPRLEALER